MRIPDRIIDEIARRLDIADADHHVAEHGFLLSDSIRRVRSQSSDSSCGEREAASGPGTMETG